MLVVEEALQFPAQREAQLSQVAEELPQYLQQVEHQLCLPLLEPQLLQAPPVRNRRYLAPQEELQRWHGPRLLLPQPEHPLVLDLIPQHLTAPITIARKSQVFPVNKPMAAPE